MRRQLLSILVASLLLAPVAAQEGLKPQASQEGLQPAAAPPEDKYQWFGNVGVGGISTNFTSQNQWKLFEYRDMSSGVLSNIDVRGRGERSYVDAFVENIGRTDAYFDVRGARYNVSSSTRCTATGWSTTSRSVPTAGAAPTRASVRAR